MIKTLTYTALAAVVATIAAIASIGHTARAAITTPLCSATDLTTQITPGSPGMGQRYATMTLTNHSDEACHTGGYVGLGFTGVYYSHNLPTHAVRVDPSEASELVLEPGAAAKTQLHWEVVPVNNEHDVDCTTGPSRLKMTPPDNYTPQWMAWGLGAVCGHGTVDITPLVPAG